MRRPDAIALVQGALIGALLAVVGLVVWTAASRPAEFPSTAAALPTTFVVPTATPRPELQITLAPDGLGMVTFGGDGEALLAELAVLLGPPNGDEHWTCLEPAADVHFGQWADLGVFVLDGKFTGWVDAVHYPPTFGPLLKLKTVEGLGIGVELEHFEAHLGDRFVFREPDPDAAENAAREFDIDGPTGIHGYVQDGEGNTAMRVPPEPASLVISLTAGTTCFDNAP